jgi:hypothetical protein
MADLDEFLTPEVTKDVRQFFDNPMETVWVWPCTNFIPPNARKVQDELCTTKEEVARKVQLILDAGFHFTGELLRSVNQMAIYITGQVEDGEGEGGEEGDAAITTSGPGRGFFDKVDEMILGFDLSKVEGGIYRRWK